MKTFGLNTAAIRSAIACAAALAMCAASGASAQQKAGNMKKQLIGSWMAVSSVVTLPDGKKSDTFGPNPQGLLIFNANGTYTLQICSANRPKFAANARDKGTPEENQAAVKGCNPHWGKYTIDEKDRAINFQIEHAMYANWEGTQQKRPYTITGDELKYVVPTASSGGTATLVWRRAK